jgi:PAS domain S-box-containing protein
VRESGGRKGKTPNSGDAPRLVRALCGGPARRHLAGPTGDTRPPGLGIGIDFYYELAETSTEVVYILDTNGTIIWLNRAFEQLTGWTRGEWLYRSFKDLLHPDDVRGATRNMSRVLGGKPHSGRCRISTRSNGYLMVAARAQPLNLAGAIMGAYGVAREAADAQRPDLATVNGAQLLPSVLDSVRDLFYVIGQDGTIKWLNEAFETMTGWPRDEWIGKTFRSILHPDDVAKAEATFAQALRGEPLPLRDYRLRRRDGGYVTVESPASTRRQLGGGGVRFFGIARDVTERRRHEEELGESEERFRQAFEYSATGMALTALDGGFLQVNAAYCRMLGYSAHELSQMTWQAITHPDDLAASEQVRRDVVASEIRHSHQLQNRYVHKDGHTVWADLVVSVIPASDGTPLYVLAQAQDITEQKLAQDALRESESRYRELVEDLNDVICELDNDGDITYISPVVEQLAGYLPSEVIGRCFTDFIHPDDVEGLLSDFRATVTAGENPRPSEYRIVAKSGEAIWVQSFSRPILRDGATVGLRGVLTDIRHRKQIEAARERARDELETRVESQILDRNPYGLTFRELTVLNLVAEGMSDKEIGLQLGISAWTAQKHLSHILAKMDAASRTEAAARALRERLVD